MDGFLDADQETHPERQKMENKDTKQEITSEFLRKNGESKKKSQV